MELENVTPTQLLTAQLFRHRCPSALMIGEYNIGLLDINSQKQLTQHFARCPHCCRELALYQSALDLQSQSNWLDRLRVWLVRPDMTLAARQPAYALRGEASELRLFSAENGIQVAINIQPDPKHGGYFAITGMIIGAENADFSADLWQDGRLIDQVAINELGNFHLSHLAPSCYELILKGTNFLLHIQTLNVQ